MASKTLNRCLVCNGTNLSLALNLGELPLANQFLPEPRELKKYPLTLVHCQDCTHTQLSEAVDRDELYLDYKYVSGTTQTLKDHFQTVVHSVSESPNKNVLDIGCNDGTLLEEFKRRGFNCTGVDPAHNLREITKEKGLYVIEDYWDSELALTLDGKFGVITALNCLAHNANPIDFLIACRIALAPRGILIVEFPYFGYTLDTGDIGQIYSEHHSYFSVKSFLKARELAKLWVLDIKLLPDLHGGTIRFTMCRRGDGFTGETPTIVELFDRETWYPTDKKLESFGRDLKNKLRMLGHATSCFKRPIYAYGASAKSSTLFNLLPKEVVDRIAWVVDDSNMKQGLYCPGSNLEIKPPESLKGILLPTILITAHNFKTEIINRLCDLGLEGSTILNYTPKVSQHPCRRI